ncbi:hypothetical protein DQ392_17975 [Streptomyces reniochalinae]|uniref:Uncharacterized protein n=1 Tax=Streptomyces reniochalinae TaxID=2250578 RepID=A0A367EHY1_9ACTN|nr:hypothetical protein DQ392_17975 [Streptomyces reniochalinae]
MDKAVKAGNAPAMGDVRQMGEGDTVWLEPAIRESKDWCRYVDAVRHAVNRGADVRWLRG